MKVASVPTSYVMFRFWSAGETGKFCLTTSHDKVPYFEVYAHVFSVFQYK
jgi:hypothetical protein